MTWNAAFPTGATLISQSVNQIQTNWAFLATDINVDHFFNTAGTEGYHRQITLVNRANPGSLPANSNGLIYENSGRIKGYDGTTSFFVPPLVASVVFNNNGGISGTPTNVTGVTKNGTGDFTINFTTNLPSTNGPWSANALASGATTLLVCGITGYTIASVRLLVKNAETGATTDPVLASFMIYYGY
jgi:hypothetical protein